MPMPYDRPYVSIIIPIRNEEQYISACLDSILTNDYPHDRLEILLLDGMSTDSSRLIEECYAKAYPFIRLLNNPRRIQVAALNAGIQAANGELIIRLDAHSTYAADYIRRCIELLQTTEADNVGGVQSAVGTNYMSRCIAIATKSRFAVGDAYYRFAEKPMWVDTVYLGAWRKVTLDDLGGFDETLEVNEDYELNYRLRMSGGKILLSPTIRCRYFVRDSLRKLIRQYFRYGFWKEKTLLVHPASLRWRQLVPPIFVACLMVCVVITFFSYPIGLALPLLYGFINLLVSVMAVRKHGRVHFPVLPIIFALIHISWGTGFLWGVVRHGPPRIGWKALRESLRDPVRYEGLGNSL